MSGGNGPMHTYGFSLRRQVNVRDEFESALKALKDLGAIIADDGRTPDVTTTKIWRDEYGDVQVRISAVD